MSGEVLAREADVKCVAPDVIGMARAAADGAGAGKMREFLPLIARRAVFCP
ncbi:MAG: hypothetical protein ACRBBT_09675 [Paracoccaceae bacterium]